MDEETPVLDTLAAMTAVSIEASTLGNRELMLARIAALAAVDAPAISYLMNVGAAADSGITVDDVQGVLIAIAPIVGTARTVSAAVKITEALGFAIAAVVAELEEELEAMEARKRRKRPDLRFRPASAAEALIERRRLRRTEPLRAPGRLTVRPRCGCPYLETPAGRIPDRGPGTQTPVMAALTQTNESNRLSSLASRPHHAGAARVAAESVDAASVGLEPGASVTPHLLWAQTMLALLEATAAAIRRPARGARFADHASSAAIRAATRTSRDGAGGLVAAPSGQRLLLAV